MKNFKEEDLLNKIDEINKRLLDKIKEERLQAFYAFYLRSPNEEELRRIEDIDWTDYAYQLSIELKKNNINIEGLKLN